MFEVDNWKTTEIYKLYLNFYMNQIIKMRWKVYFQKSFIISYLMRI